MSHESLLGKTIGGCQVLSEIGHGGMGVIYKARQLSLDRIVAMKVLAPRLTGDPLFIERFVREARAVGKINHPNILAVYDVGNQDYVHYMIMELIEGHSLSELIEDRGVLTHQEAADIIFQAARGLDHAAQAGIVHRDIKPDNIMITSDAQVKVSDFGLAKDVESSMTATDAVMGTPAFMSPEQCDGRRLDPRSDIYSLGGTFYRLITGRLPFEAETAMAMMYRHKHEPLVPPKRLVPTLPDGYNAVIVKMMAKRPEDRFQTFTEVIHAMEAAAKEPVLATGLPTAFEQVGNGERTVMDPTFQHQAPDDPLAALETASDPAGHVETRAPQVPRPGDSAQLRSQPAPETPQPAAQSETPESLLDSGTWRPATQQQVRPAQSARDEEAAREEADHHRQIGEKMAAKGAYQEAVRAYRHVVRLLRSDEKARTRLKQLEERLQAKRKAINEVRQLITQQKIEEAVKRWDALDPDLREGSLEQQIQNFKRVTLPAARLVREADDLLDAGRIEQCLQRYRKVLELDPRNEPAKRGAQESERRLRRIADLLKEGYDFNLQQQYAKAIATWERIFQISPDYAQAKKQIVEARILLGNQLRYRENGPIKALEQWKAILALDPDHRDAQQLLAEDQGRANELQSHLDQATRADRDGRTAEAMKHWKRALKIDPGNARVRQSLNQTRGKRNKRTLTFLFVMLFLGALALLGLVFGLEYKLVRDAEELLAQKKYGEAWLLIENNRKLPLSRLVPARLSLMKDTIDGLEKRAHYLEHFTTGERCTQNSNWPGAVKAYQKALKHAGPGQQTQVQMRLDEATFAALVELELEYRKGKKWKAASREVDAALALAGRSKSPALQQRRASTLKLADFYKFVLAAEEAEEQAQIDLAQQHYENARKLLPKHPAVKSWSKVRGRIQGTTQVFLDAAEAARQRGDFRREAEAYQDAIAKDPLLRAVIGPKLLYAEDRIQCDARSMVLVTQILDPASQWSRRDRKAAFCIDRFEYPNQVGAKPKVNVSFFEAIDLCQQQGKVLCSEPQWKLACRGTRRRTWPYGGTYDEKACNTAGDGLRAADLRRCASQFGVHDLSGNAAEWTLDSLNNAREGFVRGGHFSSGAAKGADGSACDSAKSYPKKLGHHTVGFRCCRKLDLR